MAIYERGKNMQWHLENIRFLHPPDDFTGSFTNDKMQARHKAMQEDKIKEIMTQLEEEQHPAEAMKVLHQKEHIKFLLNNLDYFRAAKCLEETVLALFYRKNTPFAAAGEYQVWVELFNLCDPDRIYNVGKPLPPSATIAYRGSITGKATGLSWTLSKKEVEWILDRWQDKDLGGGTVFSHKITREDILVYIEDENRQEVILKPEIAENLTPDVVSSL